ncbi:type 3 dihydrofolate reductase [Kordiimonas pumila]|uniref:Dihydrofolate reductase n=1 Tax=Kordiimonas pumila TaxID=2161677 RepID=A0ABV7D966_9PROT|nr:type 3 dihydrofolate reductase [Kordiimonas pumila]
MTLSIIVAMAKNRVIGAGNSLPWHLPADLKYFKQTTLGKSIIMGRKTFDSIGRPLLGRQNIVITRNQEWHHDGVTVVGSLVDAIKASNMAAEVMITGGAQIYREAMAVVDKLYITEVDIEVDGDATFPDFNRDEWQEVSRDKHKAEADKPGYSFVVYTRL